MVTASHNDNGWTGVKMGANRPLTFGPDEMTRLNRSCVSRFKNKAGGSYQFHENFPARYIADLTGNHKAEAKAESRGRLRQRHRRRVRAAGDGGDRLRGGAARHRTRSHLSEIQSEPRRHEDAARDPRRGAGAQGRFGLGFDGDGDRCGAVDNTGEISSPTRSASCWRATCRRSRCAVVVDVKSTGLFVTDPCCSGRARRPPTGRRAIPT